MYMSITKKLRKLTNAKIAKYAEAYEHGDQFPAITVEDAGGFYAVRDCRHHFQGRLHYSYRRIEVSVY